MDEAFFGARFLPDDSEAEFRIWAPQATRVELWIYADAMDADPVLRQPMDRQADGGFTRQPRWRRGLLRLSGLGAKLAV